MLSIVLLVVLSPWLATPARSEEKWGYWFYERETLSKPDEENQDQTIPQQGFKKPMMLTDAAIMAMHPKEIEALLNEHRDYAVWKPDNESVTNYLKIQDIVRRKALAFTAVASLSLLKNPELSAERDYPISNPGRIHKHQLWTKKIERTLSENKADYALGFFFTPHCGFCDIQKQTLSRFNSKHQWRIKAIDTLQNNEMTQQFNVDITPMVIIIERGGQKRWMPIAVGAESLDTLEQNVFRAIRYFRGEISEQQFNLDDSEKGSFFDPTSTGRSQ